MGKLVRFKPQTNFTKNFKLTKNTLNYKEFKIEGDFIELIQLLKVLGIAQTGGHAKFIVEDGEVLRNGIVELRKRAKLIPGDEITIDSIQIKLI